MTETAGPSWGARFLGLGDYPLILASASPRRAELLRDLGVSFTVRPSRIEESWEPGTSPGTIVCSLAEAKAREAGRDGERALILGADTLVVHRGVILGKPRDPEHARGMLETLSGSVHEVLTGVAVARFPEGTVADAVVTTRVCFRPLRAVEIAWMVESGEAMDKAGAYGIQGLASMAVDAIEGDYFNVVGLPLSVLPGLIRKAVAK